MQSEKAAVLEEQAFVKSEKIRESVAEHMLSAFKDDKR
ncbi:MAG: hypothetical protein ACI9CU_000112 [Polaribacter sp.]|jgi:hypothetical protein